MMIVGCFDVHSNIDTGTSKYQSTDYEGKRPSGKSLMAMKIHCRKVTGPSFFLYCFALLLWGVLWRGPCFQCEKERKEKEKDRTPIHVTHECHTRQEALRLSPGPEKLGFMVSLKEVHNGITCLSRKLLGLLVALLIPSSLRRSTSCLQIAQERKRNETKRHAGNENTPHTNEGKRGYPEPTCTEDGLDSTGSARVACNMHSKYFKVIKSKQEDTHTWPRLTGIGSGDSWHRWLFLIALPTYRAPWHTVYICSSMAYNLQRQNTHAVASPNTAKCSSIFFQFYALKPCSFQERIT
eukprot:1144016-Pelagomonas_calceolata.AAC.2